MATNTQTGIH